MENSKKIYDVISKLFYSQFGNIYAETFPDGTIHYSFEKKQNNNRGVHMIYDSEFLFVIEEVSFFFKMMGLDVRDQKEFMSETINKPVYLIV